MRCVIETRRAVVACAAALWISPVASPSLWIAVFGPAGMPADIVQRLSREFNAIVGRADIADNFNKQGFVPVGSSPAELGELVKTQLEAWRRAVREAGIPQD